MPPKRGARARGKSTETSSPGGTAAKAAAKAKAAAAQDDGPWEFRMYESRRWGQKLQKAGGAEPLTAKKLIKTLKDSRASSEGVLRRTAVEALIPAASVGNRGALAVQASALCDKSEAVRRCALSSLRAAAGAKRAEKGGAVAVALAEALPPPNASYNVEARKAGAFALEQLAPKGDPALLATAEKWLGDEDGDVRRSATRAFGVIGGGSMSEVDLMEGRLTDIDWRVGRAALESLERFAGGNCKPRRPVEFFSPGKSRSKSKASDVSSSQRSQVSSPRSLVSPGGGRRRDKEKRPPSGGKNSRPASGRAAPSTPQTPVAAAATEVLAKCCEGEFPPLLGLPRVDAIASLSRVPGAGGSALEAAASRLSDTDAEVRRHAVSAMVEMAPADPVAAMKAATKRVGSLDWRARAAARDAVLSTVAIAPKKGDQALGMVAAVLEGEDWRGRRGVSSALRLLSAGSDVSRAKAFDVLLPRLQHSDWSIRRKAVQALAEVAQASLGLEEEIGGDDRAVGYLAVMADDPEEEVRIAVAAALPKAAPAKCKEAIAIAARLVACDDEVEVRLRALESIEELCAKGRSRSRSAMFALGSFLEDDDDEVREGAERILWTLGVGRRSAVDAAAARLAHPNEKVRESAASVLRGVVTEERRVRVYKRTTVLLKNADPNVRAAASSAMAGSASDVEKAVIEAASGAVGRFRRARFLMPRGAELSDYEGSVADGEAEWGDSLMDRDSSAGASSATGGPVGNQARPGGSLWAGARRGLKVSKTLAALHGAGKDSQARKGVTTSKEGAASETESANGSRGTGGTGGTGTSTSGGASGEAGTAKGANLGRKFKAAARMVGRMAATAKDTGLEWHAPKEEDEEQEEAIDPDKSSSEGEFSESDTEPDIELPEVEEELGEGGSASDAVSVVGSQATAPR